MPYEAASWDVQARSLGFLDEAAMLKELYINQGLSLGQIAGIVESSTFTVKTRLTYLKVKMRGRGGAVNRQGKRKLVHLTTEQLAKPTHILVKQWGVDPSTVASERRYRASQVLLNQAKES